MAKSRHKPNKLFRDARERLFGSREALAEAANVYLPAAFIMNANDVGKIERGVVAYPRPQRRAALRKALRVETDAEIGLFDRREPSLDPSNGTCLDGTPKHDSAPGWNPLCIPGAAVDTRGPNLIGVDHIGQDQNAGSPLERLHLLSIDTPTPSSVEWADVEHVRYMTSALALSENTYGGGFSGQAATAQLRHSAQLVHTRASNDVRRAMYEAVGNLGGVVGFSAFDVDNYKSARICFDFELWCAEKAQSWPLRACALSDMARLELYLGNNDNALSLIELAQVRSDRLSTKTQAMLCAIRARLLALQGRHQEAHSEVARADAHYYSERVPERDPPWMTYYDEAEHQGSTGRALLPIAVRNRDLELALPRLKQAVLLHDDNHPRSRAFSRTRLASLMMSVGDPKEAASVGRIVVAEASTLRSSRLRSEIEHLATLAIRCERIPEVADLRREIVDSNRQIGAC